MALTEIFKKKLLQLHFEILLWVLTLCGCISVQIPRSPLPKTADLKFQPPGNNFQETFLPQVDKAWKNPLHSSSISFLTECHNSVEESLITIQRSILQGMQNLNIEDSHYQNYNQRQSLWTTARGEVDGLDSKIHLIIFNKNSCLFVLTYVAKYSNYPLDLPEFHHFLTEFVVP